MDELVGKVDNAGRTERSEAHPEARGKVLTVATSKDD
jgi:hypothetical protein